MELFPLFDWHCLSKSGQDLLTTKLFPKNQDYFLKEKIVPFIFSIEKVESMETINTRVFIIY
jgi:hypothetical protein